MSRKRIIVLSGAGVSAESGIATFRDADGLWENHRVEDVATPEAFQRDPELVQRFYNLRRAYLKQVVPNDGHRHIAKLEDDYEVVVITQNIDDLHERAGSSRVIHLHGELRKVRPVTGYGPFLDWHDDLNTGDTDERGIQLRPHVVWFGEAVPEMENAAREVARADAVIIVGTSLQVYPAAGLVGYAPDEAPVVYIDPDPKTNYELQQRGRLHLIPKGGSEGMVEATALLEQLLD